MLSIDLIINNKLENASKNLIPFYWENDAIMKFKQKLIRAHKFVVGMEFFFFIEAIENYTYGVDYDSSVYKNMGEEDLRKIDTDFLKNPKKMKKLKQDWKEYCQHLPFPEIFIESSGQGYLLEQGDDGVIYIYEVKSIGLLTPCKYVIVPNALDPEFENQKLGTMIMSTQAAEGFEQHYLRYKNIQGVFAQLLALQIYQILMFINCKNINIIKYKPKKSELSKIPKVLQKGYEYHVVKLSNEVTNYVSLTEVQNDVRKSVSRELKAHVVRGHFKRRSSGVFWWNSFLRGHRKNGVIEKHYEVG